MTPEHLERLAKHLYVLDAARKNWEPRKRWRRLHETTRSWYRHLVLSNEPTHPVGTGKCRYCE